MFIYKGKAIKSIGLFGYGKSNEGIYKYLSSLGEDLRFTLRTDTPCDTGGVKFEKLLLGGVALKRINEDILFLSPSVRRDKPELEFAEKRGVILSSDAEFFLSLTKADIYAVTGSDGKSTTTTLSSLMLRDSYASVIPCGNIGEAMTPHLHDGDGVAYCAELSSFQLSYMKPIVKRALITNITENHLNWHTSFKEYINAKRNIFENAKERIINFDCPITRSFAKDYPIFAVFSRKESEDELRRKIRAELYVTERDGSIVASGERMLATSDIMVNGEHNVLNFMAAIAMSYGLASRDHIRSIALEFSGLPHRCEFIREHRGVKYYDSSIDSSPNRTIETLKSFNDKVIVILGGRSKGLDFSPLVPALREKAKAIVITGECAPEISEVLSRHSAFGNTIPFAVKDDLCEAVEYAAANAVYGDSVLLSPAATSYDKYKNFEERGDAFRDLINGL